MPTGTQPGGLQGGGGPPSGKRTVRAVTTKGKSKKPAFNQKAFISGGGQTRPPPTTTKVRNKQKKRKKAGGVNIEKNWEWNDAVCSNMDGPRRHHTRQSRSETAARDASYRWNLQCGRDEPVSETGTDSQMYVPDLGSPKGKGGYKLGFWINGYTQLYIKQINNTGLFSVPHRELYSVSCHNLYWKRIWKYIYNWRKKREKLIKYLNQEV